MSLCVLSNIMEKLNGDVKEEQLKRTKIGTKGSLSEWREAKDLHAFYLLSLSPQKKWFLKLKVHYTEFIVKSSKRSYSQRTTKEEET